jgi:hypothetical protein
VTALGYHQWAAKRVRGVQSPDGAVTGVARVLAESGDFGRAEKGAGHTPGLGHSDSGVRP